MKKTLLPFIILAYGIAAFAADNAALVAETGYTADEKAQLTALIGKAESRGLPAALLANKAKEASMKKIGFARLMPVMEQRLASMAEADAALSGKEIAVKNRQYAVQVLTELQEKGIKRQVYGRMLDAAVTGKKDFDDVAKYFDVLGKYNTGSVPVEDCADILAACIGRNVSPGRGERLLYAFTEAGRNNVPLAAAKELILDGIAHNRRIEEIDDAVRCETVRESRADGNARREREGENEQLRGRTGTTGGNGARRGR